MPLESIRDYVQVGTWPTFLPGCSQARECLLEVHRNVTRITPMLKPACQRRSQDAGSRNMLETCWREWRRLASVFRPPACRSQHEVDPPRHVGSQHRSSTSRPEPIVAAARRLTLRSNSVCIAVCELAQPRHWPESSLPFLRPAQHLFTVVRVQGQSQQLFAGACSGLARPSTGGCLDTSSLRIDSSQRVQEHAI